jgi:hypothetical protein
LWRQGLARDPNELPRAGATTTPERPPRMSANPAPFVLQGVLTALPMID